MTVLIFHFRERNIRIVNTIMMPSEAIVMDIEIKDKVSSPNGGVVGVVV